MNCVANKDEILVLKKFIYNLIGSEVQDQKIYLHS